MHETIRWLASRSKKIGRMLVLTVALGELAGILLILQTSLLVRIANGVIFLRDTLVTLELPFILLLLFLLLRAGVSWASKRAAFRCSASVKQELRSDIVRHLRAVGPLRLIGEHAGEIASTAVDGVEALDAYYARYLPQRAIASLLPLTILAVVFPLDWISGTTLFVTALFIPVLMVLIGQEAHERNQRLWNRISRMSSYFLDLIQGITTLKIFGASRREVAVIAATAEEYRVTTMGVMRVAFASALMLELVSTVSIAIVAIVSGLRMLAGSMPFAHGYFILLLAPDYFLTLRSLGTQYHARMEAAAAAEQILKLLKLPAAAAARPVARRAERDWERPPAVEVRGVSAAYPAGTQGAALREVSFMLEAGAQAVVVGASGAGKSTLLALLLGFLPAASGKILVDGAPLETIERGAWLRRVAWLPQRPTLFLGTVAENIRLARPEAGRDEVIEAARRAHADEFIRRLKDGYDTVVGERGQGLSGGQIQRIALARLFLRPAGFLLLDEPTAHLDREGEGLATEAIGRLADGKSVLLVTHRPGAAEAAGTIHVMEGGRLVESGTHAELVARRGCYARLVARGAEEGE